MLLRILVFAFLGSVFIGPVGALIGAALAAWIPTQALQMHYVRGQSAGRRRHTQKAFSKATFLVMGKLAKSDGRVNEEEIQLASSLMSEMRLSAEQRKQAIKLFNQGKNPGCDIREVLLEFRQASGSGSLIQMFVELQLQAAYADGQMSRAELEVLHWVCECLGINRFTFEVLHQRFLAQRAFYSRRNSSRGYQQQPAHQQQSKRKEAYATLGVLANATGKEIKRAYRKLMSEHHPDKLVAKGLPEEMMEMAKKKTQEIQAAYDLIQEERKKR